MTAASVSPCELAPPAPRSLPITELRTWRRRREIVTLQLGPFSNYVGAHFWNVQVSRLLALL